MRPCVCCDQFVCIIIRLQIYAEIEIAFILLLLLPLHIIILKQYGNLVVGGNADAPFITISNRNYGAWS